MVALSVASRRRREGGGEEISFLMNFPYVSVKKDSNGRLIHKSRLLA